MQKTRTEKELAKSNFKVCLLLRKRSINQSKLHSYLKVWIRTLDEQLKSNIKKQAYDLHTDVNDLESNFAENAHSFLCQGSTLPKLSDSGKKASSVKVGAACSGIGVVLIALKNMGVNFRQTFDCDNCPEVQTTIRANHDPEIF